MPLTALSLSGSSSATEGRPMIPLPPAQNDSAVERPLSLVDTNDTS